MLLRRGQLVAGIDAIALRDSLGSEIVSADSLSHALGLVPARGSELVQPLVEQGFLEALGCDGWHYLTPKGASLAMARIGKPISKDRADRLVSQLIERARQANSQSDCPSIVAGLGIFGSYLTSSNELGDLDVAVHFVDKQPGEIKSLLDFAATHGPPRLSYMNRLLFAHRWLRNILKARSPYLSIMAGDDPITLGARVVEVYSAHWDPISERVVEQPTGDWAARYPNVRRHIDE